MPERRFPVFHIKQGTHIQLDSEIEMKNWHLLQFLSFIHLLIKFLPLETIYSLM